MLPKLFPGIPPQKPFFRKSDSAKSQSSSVCWADRPSRRSHPVPQPHLDVSGYCYNCCCYYYYSPGQTDQSGCYCYYSSSSHCYYCSMRWRCYYYSHPESSHPYSCQPDPPRKPLPSGNGSGSSGTGAPCCDGDGAAPS